MVGIIFVLILIVTVLALVRPEGLKGTRPLQRPISNPAGVHEATTAGHGFYAQDSDVFPYLLAWIEKYKPATAVLIQYSGHAVMPIVRKLLENGSSVALWLQAVSY